MFICYSFSSLCIHFIVLFDKNSVCHLFFNRTVKAQKCAASSQDPHITAVCQVDPVLAFVTLAPFNDDQCVYVLQLWRGRPATYTA